MAETMVPGNEGANVKLVQLMLGHKSAAMTLDIYSDLFADDLETVATKLNARAAAAGVVEMWDESLAPPSAQAA